MATLASRPPRPSLARRLLGSPVVDLLLGPHGVDRYLELIRPTLTVTRGPGRGDRGHAADGAQRDPHASRPTGRGRASRPASTSPSASRSTASGAPARIPPPARRIGAERARADRHRASRRRGLRASAAHGRARDGRAPRRRPGNVHPARARGRERLVLISGGSGITPVLSMLRTLVDEGHDGEVAFLHFARTAADWLYEREVRRAGRRPPRPARRLPDHAGGGAAPARSRGWTPPRCAP